MPKRKRSAKGKNPRKRGSGLPVGRQVGSRHGFLGALHTAPQFAATVRHLYEDEGFSIASIAKMYGAPRSSLQLFAQREGWARKDGVELKKGMPNKQAETTVPTDVQEAINLIAELAAKKTGSPVQPDVPRGKNGLEIKKNEKGRPVLKRRGLSAKVITFPGIKTSRKRGMNASAASQTGPGGAGAASDPAAGPEPGERLLPRLTAKESERAMKTLRELRAILPIESLRRLERLEGILERYAGWMDLYLDPLAHIETNGLHAFDVEEKAVRTQTLALKLLLPTDKDTLTGAMTTLTTLTAKIIDMQRRIAGIPDVKPTLAEIETDKAIAAEQERAAREAETNLEQHLDTMPVADLRKVTEAMELLQKRQHQGTEPPKPPPPLPLDDIYEDENDPEPEPHEASR